MLNRVSLIGRWTKEIDLRYVPSGKAVANGTLAVDSGWGEKKQTEFVRVTMWEKLGENVAQYSGKGQLVYVDGRMATRNYETDGQKKYITEVIANEVKFLDRPKQEPVDFGGEEIDIDESDIPF